MNNIYILLDNLFGDGRINEFDGNHETRDRKWIETLRVASHSIPIATSNDRVSISQAIKANKQVFYNSYRYRYRLFSICRPTTSTYVEVHYFEEVVAGGIPANGSSSKTLLNPLTSTCFINSNYSRGKDLEYDLGPGRESKGGNGEIEIERKEGRLVDIEPKQIIDKQIEKKISIEIKREALERPSKWKERVRMDR